MGSDDLDGLARLFATQRSTRHCWCTAFCVPRTQFSLGWLTGANRRTFAGLAARSEHPMGVLATAEGQPVGWAAAGPRSRYAVAAGATNSPLRHRDRAEDEAVWLVPCVFVRAGHRGQGVSHALVRAAVALAGGEGAAAIEGWPLVSAARRPAEAFLGREEVFTAAGFRRAGPATGDRVLMRFALS